MKNALRLAALVGILVISSFAQPTPGYGIMSCEAKEGSACPEEGASSSCFWYGSPGGSAIYPCQCDGSLRWRCGL